ncbi:MAG: hypothetical protein ACIWVG_07315 [Gloeotrichia echinulata HAB0833]|jgi:hypothetical protein
MLKIQLLFLSLSAATLNLIVTSLPARANCTEQIASSEIVIKAMQRHWQDLQQQKIYPWGETRPYDKLSGNLITLTPAFDKLRGEQKQQVITEVLAYKITPEERKNAGDYLGTYPPHSVYANDGRIVFYPYDGCTPLTLFTEKQRYSSYFYRSAFNSNKSKIEQESRNVGQAPGRKVRFPITATQEKKIRLLFWKTIGYEQINQEWWIAWVPENGYFEINLKRDYDKQLLQKFLQTAPRQYRYVLVATDGTFL